MYSPGKPNINELGVSGLQANVLGGNDVATSERETPLVKRH